MRPLIAVLVGLIVLGVTPIPAEAAPVTRRLAVVIIQNGDSDTERTQLADTTYIRGVFFGTSASLTSWMPAVSHGLLSFTPAGDGVFVAQPSTALLNANKTGCHSDLARTNAQEHLTTLGVAWDSLAIVFDVYGCTWAGLGQMPGRVTWYTPRPSLSVIVHELGHNQGYPHQSKRDCPGGDLAACRANDTSGNTPMGSGGSGRGYSSVELMHSGWLEPSWLRQVSAPGVFTLQPLHAPMSVTGVRVLEYRVSASLAYVIETRARGTAVDTSVNNPGVRVYAVTNRDYKNAYMINPGTVRYVPTGTVLTDTASKLTITVRASTQTGATVAVQAIAPPPAPRTSAPRSAAASPSPSPSLSDSPAPPTDFEPSPMPSDDTVPGPGQLTDNLSSSEGFNYVILVSALAMLLGLLAAGVILFRQRHHPRHRMR